MQKFGVLDYDKTSKPRSLVGIEDTKILEDVNAYIE